MVGIKSLFKSRDKSQDTSGDAELARRLSEGENIGTSSAKRVELAAPSRTKKLVKRSYVAKLERQQSDRAAKGEGDDTTWTDTGAFLDGLASRPYVRDRPAPATATRRRSGDTTVTEATLPPYQPPTYTLMSVSPTDDVSYLRHPTPCLQLVAQLPSEIWRTIATHLNPYDAGNLAASNKVLRLKLGAFHTHLSFPLHKHRRIAQLLEFDYHYPNHLFCFNCTKFHPRVKIGLERLPLTNLIDVYNCPNATNLPAPRLRLADKRILPFAMVQLMMRHKLHGDAYGVPPEALGRRWVDRETGWTHNVRFVIVPYPFADASDPLDMASGSTAFSEISNYDDLPNYASDSTPYNPSSSRRPDPTLNNPNQKYHVLMRCTSTHFATAALTQSEERLFLYSRNDYAPYFSACAHWNGPLMPLAKCALRHVPAAPDSVVSQLHRGPRVSISKANPNQMPRQCDECRPIRRCSACPTEYMFRVKFVEDKQDVEKPFKHAMSVTRWSDLGDASSPWVSESSSTSIASPSNVSPRWDYGSKEWAAIVGEDGTGVGGKMNKDGSWSTGRSKGGSYDSFGNVGRLTLCSRFEMAVGNEPPGERCLPLNYDENGKDTY